jgi:hypothetical protein
MNKRLTITQRTIHFVASIGFLFETYELMMLLGGNLAHQFFADDRAISSSALRVQLDPE